MKNANKEDVESYNRYEGSVCINKYPLSREKRDKVHKFINKQLRKEYIRLSKLPQTTLVFFVEKKDSRKHMVQDYRY